MRRLIGSTPLPGDYSIPRDIVIEMALEPWRDEILAFTAIIQARLVGDWLAIPGSRWVEVGRIAVKPAFGASIISVPVSILQPMDRFRVMGDGVKGKPGLALLCVTVCKTGKK